MLQVLRRAVFASAGVSIWVAGRWQQPTFRSAVTTVSIYATVSDASGRLVPDLVRDDFQVFDNDRPAEISVFSNDTQPITVAIMLQMGGNVMGTFLRAREGTQHFIDALAPADRARIGTYGDEIALSPLLTGNKADLMRVLNDELWPWGESIPLWNAMDAAMTSLAGYGEVSARATNESFMVYALSLPITLPKRAPWTLSAAIIGLAEMTGGGHVDVRPEDNLAAIFVHVAEELRHQYVIGFQPATLDGKVHKLQVRLRPKGLKARARTNYLAVASR